MARYNVRNMTVVEVSNQKMWQVVLENGKKIRAIGKKVFEYSTTAKKYKQIENNAVISVNRLNAYRTIEKFFGKIQKVKTLDGQKIMAEHEKGKRGRKSLSFYSEKI